MQKIFFLFISMHLMTGLALADIHIIQQKTTLSNDPRELYIDLIKRCVANTIYEDVSFDGYYSNLIREEGKDWPTVAHTMVGMKRLDNVHYCIKQILENNIPGDCIETGVWRGGTTILMRAILKAYEIKDRRVWAADSFAGLPMPNLEKYPQDQGLNLYLSPELAVSLEQVQQNFQKYNLLDEQVVFLKGFFSDTLATAPIDKLALIRLDGDLYESTIQALEALYPKLSVGGFVIVDDFGAIEACAQAIRDYRSLHKIDDPLIAIDWTGVFWQKS